MIWVHIWLVGLMAVAPLAGAQLPVSTSEVSLDTTTSTTTETIAPIAPESTTHILSGDTALALPNRDEVSRDLTSTEQTAEATVRTTLQTTEGEILTTLPPVSISGSVTAVFPVDYPLDSVVIEFSSPAPTTTLVTSRLDGIPLDLPAAPTHVALAGVVQLELLAPNGTDMPFDQASLHFTIPSFWRSENCPPTECRVMVLHYAAGGWETLPPELLGSAADGQRYRAVTHSFSPFAIVGVPEPDPLASGSSGGPQSLAAGPGGSADTEPTSSAEDDVDGKQAPFPAAARGLTDAEESSESGGLVWSGVVALVVLGLFLAGMAVLGVWVHRRRNHGKSADDSK